MSRFAGCLGLCAATLLIPTPTLAQDMGRAKRWEFTVGTRYLGSESLRFDNSSQADVDGSWGFLFGLAYNFNERFSLGGEISWATMDYFCVGRL